MPKSPRYTAEHASAGLDHNFPEIETWPNQFPGYEIAIDDPEVRGQRAEVIPKPFR